MKTTLLLAAAALTLSGCADRTAYYESVERLSLARVQADNARMEIFAQAMNRAAETADSGDDVALAIMFMQGGQQPQQLPEAPHDFVDGLEAMVPFASIMTPWIAGAWAVNKIGENSGSTYTSSGESDMAVDTYQVDSQNEAGSLGTGGLEECLSNPPGGYGTDGTPMLYPGMSCGSYGW